MYRKLLPYAFFFFAACALLSPGNAWAQQPQPTPRFVFVETSPISLEPGEPSKTLLQNNTAEELEVVVEVTDVDPKDPSGVSTALNFAPQTVKLLPAGSKVIKINPPPASVTNYGAGYLIAVERGKGFARREIKSRAPAAPTSTPTATPKIVEPAVPVDSLQSIYLPGINFYPSFISHFSPIAPWRFIIPLLLLLMAPFIWFSVRLLRSSGPRGSTDKKRGFVLVVLSIVLLVLIVGYRLCAENKPSWVVVPPVSLISSQKLTGGLISADGSLGKLEADGSQLKATDISRAGAYTGILKITKDATIKEVKEITVASNVSDWWPYAFLTFTCGVLLGYYLTRYFKQQRGEDEQRVRAAQLWLRVSEDESHFLLEHGGQPYVGYSIAAATQRWLATAESMIAMHDAAKAKESLGRLDAYIDLFTQFRGQLFALNNLQTNVWESISWDEPEIAQNRAGVKVFRETDEALKGKPLSFVADEEQKSTTLKAYQLRVQELIDWLETLEKSLIAINSYLDIAEQQGWGQDALDKFRQARQAAITAINKEDLVKKDNEAAAAYANILKTVVADAGNEAALEIKAFALKARAVIAARVQPGAQIKLSLLTPATNGKGQHDPDDLLVFTANIDSPAALGLYRLQWDFGDGTTSDLPASALRSEESVKIQVSHRYSEGGAKKVTIKDSKGDVLGKLEVMVEKGPGRAERLLAAFRLTEWQMSIVTGLVAIGLGFYTYYLSKTVWGTPADYLYALLWGSIVSEGLKYAAGLVERVLTP